MLKGLTDENEAPINVTRKLLKVRIATVKGKGMEKRQRESH